MNSFHATVMPAYAEVAVGQVVELQLSIGNLSTVIDGYSVRVFGLDLQWVIMDPVRLSLFPGDSGIVTISVHVPDNFPAGLRQISVHAQSDNDPSAFELVTVNLHVGSLPRLKVTIDPNSITGGSKAQYGLVVANHGNSVVDVTPEAVDPEDEAEITFNPPSTHLLPGEQVVVQAMVRAPRPWVGQPTVRVLTFAATGPDRVEAIATFVQRPRIGRWVLSVAGLIAAAAVFAAVLSHTLTSVVDEAKVSDKVVNEALASGQSTGERVSVTPATVSGKVVSITTGTGIAGVQAQLFRSDDGTVPVASAATGDDGSYAFGRLNSGTYRIKFSGAGFADQWYDVGRVFAEGKDLLVKAGAAVPVGNLKLSGRPGIVSGKVIAPDVTGAKVQLIVPGLADPATSAVVASVDVSADGTFSLPDVPSPANYQLVVTRPGNAAETRDVVLGPAQVITGLEVRLRVGDGLIGGHVTANGQPLGGAQIVASDGTNAIDTVSLTDGDVGTFALRNLATPGQYTLTVSIDGYATESRTIALRQGETSNVDISLRVARGGISGQVFAASGDPLGGVSVMVSGGAQPVKTSTISQGDATGSWSVGDLAAPGAYTVTFSKDGFVDQTRLVTVDGSAANGITTGINAALVSSMSTITGTVLDSTGQPRPLASVELTDGVTKRTVATANAPAGAFGLSSVLPGSYTLTVSYVGATPVVQVVTVQAGETRDVQLQLGLEATIGGRVVDGNGQLFTKGEVRLFIPETFPGGTPTAVVPIAANGTYSFSTIIAPANYVVAVYASPAAIDPLDSELLASVPGEAVVIADLVVPTQSATEATPTPTSTSPNSTSSIPMTATSTTTTNPAPTSSTATTIPPSATSTTTTSTTTTTTTGP
jgi:hypothetical protein